MRVVQCYRFCVGTKIPFNKWPEIIEKYLQEQNLHHHSFHYYLESYDDSERCRSILDGTRCETCGAPEHYCVRCREYAEETLRKGTGCERAVKENPFLGQIHVQQARGYTRQILHNFSDESNQSKEKIYRIINKIYRRYGFGETRLIYWDIDFFSSQIRTPMPEIESSWNALHEYSGITLWRDIEGRDNAILLSVASYYPGEVHDATPYADALSQLLPDIKRKSFQKVIMDEDEESQYEEWNFQAKTLISRARDFFYEHMPEEKGNDEPEAKANVASWLKKLGKRYGYTYSGYMNYIYFLEKKLSNGHYICLEFVSNPLSPDADPYVKLCGLGFNHEIWVDGFSPQNSRDTSDYFTKLFDTLAQAEKTVFAAILDLYPNTPDWFMPTH